MNSSVYSAYGPVPTTVGVTADAPRVNGSLDRRQQHVLPPIGHSATLGRHGGPQVALLGHNHLQEQHIHQPEIGRSCQDLQYYARHQEALALLKARPPPSMEPLQPLDTFAMAKFGIHDHMESFPSPTATTTTLDRRRNGGPPTATSQLQRSSEWAARGPQVSTDSRVGGCCCRRTCCTLTLSVLACLLILGGVIVALYFYIKCR
ncbi:unnamed protein product, partial [Meganyctiphanes norvegica]